jgi:hypothetical protein
MNQLIASVGALVFLTACSTLPTERQLIGTWTAPKSSIESDGVRLSHSKQMIDLTLTPDHRFVWSVRGQGPTDFGRWQLDGRRLITEYANRGKGHKVAHEYRDKIIKVSPNELIYVQGEDETGEEVHLTKR